MPLYPWDRGETGEKGPLIIANNPLFVANKMSGHRKTNIPIVRACIIKQEGNDFAAQFVINEQVSSSEALARGYANVDDHLFDSTA